MNRRAVVTTACAAIAVVAAVASLEAPAPSEHAPGWIPAKATMPRVEVFDSGPRHTQWITCTGCAAELRQLQQALNLNHGLGKMVGGAYVSTPRPSTRYSDGGLALLADGGLFEPTTDVVAPLPHPTLPETYKFEVLDRDYDEIMATIADAGLSARLPLPASTLDPSWFAKQEPQ